MNRQTRIPTEGAASDEVDAPGLRVRVLFSFESEDAPAPPPSGVEFRNVAEVDSGEPDRRCEIRLDSGVRLSGTGATDASKIKRPLRLRMKGGGILSTWMSVGEFEAALESGKVESVGFLPESRDFIET